MEDLPRFVRTDDEFPPGRFRRRRVPVRFLESVQRRHRPGPKPFRVAGLGPFRGVLWVFLVPLPGSTL